MRTYLEAEEKGVNDATIIGISTGIKIIISLLKEASLHNSNLRDETLAFLLSMLSKVKPLGLWGVTHVDRVLDRSLHTVVNFLEEIVLSKETPEKSKEKAFKVLFSLGLLRGSLPNLLCIVNLLRIRILNVDFQRELNSFLKERPHVLFDFIA